MSRRARQLKKDVASAPMASNRSVMNVASSAVMAPLIK